MRIQVAEVGEVITQTGKNNKPYQVFDFTYYNNGKKLTKKITQFSDVYKTLKASAPDQMFTIETKQNGQFTEWVSAVPNTDTPESTPNRVSVPISSRSTYETPEERAVKQERITRSACLNTAVATLTNTKKGFTKEDVIETADFFRNYVYNTPTLGHTDDTIRVE